MSPYRIVFGNHCHLPLDLEYKAMWAIKKLNFNFQAVKEKKFLQLCTLEDWRMKPMTMQEFTKIRPRNGMTRGY